MYIINHNSLENDMANLLSLKTHLKICRITAFFFSLDFLSLVYVTVSSCLFCLPLYLQQLLRKYFAGKGLEMSSCSQFDISRSPYASSRNKFFDVF